MLPRCEDCDGQLIVLETFCTNPYNKNMEWFRDVKKKCVCDYCGREQEITVETIKQARWFK